MSTTFVIWHLFEYHLATWYFLRQRQKTCVFRCHCGTSNDMTISKKTTPQDPPHQPHPTELTANAQKSKCHKNQGEKKKRKTSLPSPISIISLKITSIFFQLFPPKKNNPHTTTKKKKHQLLEHQPSHHPTCHPAPPNLRSPWPSAVPTESCHTSLGPEAATFDGRGAANIPRQHPWWSWWGCHLGVGMWLKLRSPQSQILYS